LRLRMMQGAERPDRSRPTSDQGPVSICIPASGRSRFGIARKLRRVRRRISFQPLLWPTEQVIKCLRSIERDPQKWKPVLPGQTPSFVPRSRSNLLKERMIFSPNRSHFGGSCARNREHSVIQSVCQIPAAKCTQSRVLSIGEFGARALGVCRLNHDRRGKQDESSCSKDRRVHGNLPPTPFTIS